MPCCNVPTYNPRFVEPKCEDGCFCILTNGKDCICLFTDEDNKVKRCKDCNCEKSSCNCGCAENPCTSNKKCSCFSTKGKTCVCVNIDKNGNIKVCDDCQCVSTNENPKISSKCIKTNVSQVELTPSSNCPCPSVDDGKNCQCIPEKSIKCSINNYEINVEKCKDHQYMKNDIGTDSDKYCHDCKCVNKNKRCICLATEGQPCVCISMNKNGKINFCKECQCVSGKGIKCTSDCGNPTPKEIKPCNNIGSSRNGVCYIKNNKTCIDCACSSQEKDCVCLATPNGNCVCVYTDKNSFVQICEDCQCSSRKIVKRNENCIVKKYTKPISRGANMYCAKCACKNEDKKCVCLALAGKECICVYTDKKGNIKLCEDCECASEEECMKHASGSCVCKYSNMQSKVQCYQDCQCAREMKCNVGPTQCFNHRRYTNSYRECSMRPNRNISDNCTGACETRSRQCKTFDSCVCRDQKKHGLINSNEKRNVFQYCEDCQCVSTKSLNSNALNSHKGEENYCKSFVQTINTICKNCTRNDEENRCVCLVVEGKNDIFVNSDDRGSILCENCNCAPGRGVLKRNVCDKNHCQSSCNSDVYCQHLNRSAIKLCASCACKDQNKYCVCLFTADKLCFCVHTDKLSNIQPCEDCQCTSEQRKKSNSLSSIKQCKSCSNSSPCSFESKLFDSCACKEKNNNCVCFVTAAKACVCMNTNNSGNVQCCIDCQCVSKNNLKGSDFKTEQCNNRCCKSYRFRQSKNMDSEHCTRRNEVKKCICLITPDKSCEDCKCCLANQELKIDDYDKNQCKNSSCSTTGCKLSNRTTAKICDTYKCKN